MKQAKKSTGPFSLGIHTVVGYDNREVDPPICVITSSNGHIQYRRRDAFYDRKARNVHSGKVVRTGSSCKVKVGRNQWVRARLA